MSRQRWILLGLLSAMIDICCLSLDAFFNVAHAQTEDLPPKIYVSIPDLAAYWIKQPPILKVVANDDHDPNPRVSAWLNGQLVDVTSPALIENPGIYFLKVEAEDNRFNKSIHSIIFEVLDVPKYQAEITPLWLDYRVDMLSGTVSIEALLLLSNPSFYPRLQIDPHDPRLRNVALCRVSRYSWTMLLTDEDGATVSDPIPLPSEDEAALCDA